MNNLNVDVCVIGGGCAGIAAALGASRAGASVCLIERNASFGGQATNSQVTAFCGFYTRGAEPDQVVMGVGEELLSRMRGYGANTKGVISPSTGNASIRFDPEIVKLAMDDMLVESDVKYLLHTSLIGVTIDNGLIKAVSCIDDEGVYEISAKAFVDASGNGNLVHLAGIATEWGDENGNVQQTSLPFRLDNLPRKLILKSELEAAIKAGKAQGIPHLEKETGLIIKIPEANYGYCTIPSMILNDLSAETMTTAEVTLRRQVNAYTQAFKQNLPGMEDVKVVSSGPQIGIREARRIVGEQKLIGTEIVRGPKCEDSVARGGWSPEMHRSNTALEYTHIPDNDYFSIPLGALKVKDAINLWAAGRNICSDSLALGSVRVMGTGLATGHAAGVAAALTLDKKEADVKKVQAELLAQNALI